MIGRMVKGRFWIAGRARIFLDARVALTPSEARALARQLEEDATRAEHDEKPLCGSVSWALGQVKYEDLLRAGDS